MAAYLSLVFDQAEELKSEVSTSLGLIALTENLYNSLKEDEALVLIVRRDCTLICTRKKGHGDKALKKISNFGFASGSNARIEGLCEAVKNITDDLPQYCFEALLGDASALRLTSEHLLKVYEKKAERMTEKKKPKKEIAKVLASKDQISRYLELDDKELTEVVNAIVIEVPKNPNKFGKKPVAIGNKSFE